MALTFRKFLHWRAVKLIFLLAGTGFVTIGLLNHKASRQKAEQQQQEFLSIDCEVDIRQLGCSNPAFSSQWSIIPGIEIELFSAHLDDRIKDDEGVTQYYVRTIALLKKSAIEIKYFCIVNYPSGAQRTVRAFIEKIWIDSWDNGTFRDLLTPYILSCRIGSAPVNGQLPASVSIVTDVCACPSNNLRLKRLIPNQPKKDFAVCVKGLFYPNDISNQLSQWIEMIFLLGAKHIHFYQYHVHPKTKKLLKFYEKFRQVSIEKLSLPPRHYPQGKGYLETFLKSKVWEKRRLELVPYNDCYYRFKDSYDYIALLDIDEVIVPRDPDVLTWAGIMDRINDVENEARTKYASFAFTNAYFFRPKDQKQDLLAQTERSANFSRPGFAVKSFFTAEGSLAVFNHYTLIPLKANLRKCAIVGTDIALVHHYRDSCPAKMELDCVNNFMKYKTTDNTIQKFERRLNQAIEELKYNMKNAMF